MNEKMFRPLRADEIECRIGQVKPNGLSLLLYKDARADQNILDETVGAFNWQRSHSRDNANCTVSIWDNAKGQWISKEDTGTESNTEAEKGIASDSFKRACFNWGIGRELYTSPKIWVSADKCNIQGNKCYDKFGVLDIGYANGVINRLAIANEKTGELVFRMGQKIDPTPPANEAKFVCTDCGETIKPWVTADGKTKMSVREVAQNSEKDYGRRLCLGCIKKLQAIAALEAHEN